MFEIGKDYYYVYPLLQPYMEIRKNKLQRIIKNSTYFCGIDEILLMRFGYKKLLNKSYKQLKTLCDIQHNRFGGDFYGKYKTDYLLFEGHPKTSNIPDTTYGMVFDNREEADICGDLVQTIYDISVKIFNSKLYMRMYFK